MANPTYITASENPLFKVFNFTNESISQLEYPIFYNVSSNFNLSILSNNLASFTFNATNPTVAYAFALSSVILNEDAIRLPVNCIYPLSGAYDTLSRILFYILMVFSLVFQRQKDLSLAALGSAMVYAAVTAIHALVLVTEFSATDFTYGNIFSTKSYADPDLFGLFPILAVSAVMLTPILMWSNAVRDFHGQPILLWAALILAALGAVIATVLRGNEDADIDSVTSFALCTNRSPMCLSFESNPDYTILPKSVYEACDCTDYCSTFSPIAPMRNGANMVVWSTYNSNFSSSKIFINLVVVGIPLLVFVCVSGIFGLLESFWSQEDVRNGIFSFINNRQFTSLHNRPKAKAAQLIFAKWVAAFVFSLGLIVTVLAPALFIYIVVVFELFLLDFPYSEHSDAVGAWGNCVGAALILIATVIGSYQYVWAEFIRTIFSTSRRKNEVHTQRVNPNRKSTLTSITETCLKPITKSKAVLNNFVTFWRDPERVCAERREHKERENRLRKELEEAKKKHLQELYELQLRIRELRSGSHIIQPDDPIIISPTDTNTDWDQENQGGKVSFGSLRSINVTYAPVATRSFSVVGEDIEFQSLKRGPPDYT